MDVHTTRVEAIGEDEMYSLIPTLRAGGEGTRTRKDTGRTNCKREPSDSRGLGGESEGDRDE